MTDLPRMMCKMPKVLLVDDDPYLLDALCHGFGREGFEVIGVGTGRQALRQARGGRVDLVVLAASTPDMHGFEILAALWTFSAIPVIMLTNHSRDEDIVAGFDRGADDCVTKPFSVRVLVARAKAALRRAAMDRWRDAAVGAGGGEARTQTFAGARFERDANTLVAADGAQVRLTPTEGRILRLLLAHGGQALSTESIMERVWGYDSESGVAVVKTHILHLREKIALLPGCPQPIRTLPGVGYMLTSDEGAGDRDRSRAS